MSSGVSGSPKSGGVRVVTRDGPNLLAISRLSLPLGEVTISQSASSENSRASSSSSTARWFSTANWKLRRACASQSIGTLRRAPSERRNGTLVTQLVHTRSTTPEAISPRRVSGTDSSSLLPSSQCSDPGRWLLGGWVKYTSQENAHSVANQ